MIPLHKFLFLLFASVLFPIFTAIGQAITFTGTAIPAALGLSEQFHLTYTLNTEGSGFKPPQLSDFYILQGPSQSSSMQFINGNMSQSLSYSYVLQPKSVGTFKLGAATILVKGNTINSNVVTIQVNKSAVAGSEQETLEKQISENIYIKVTADKTKVVKGEAIKIIYKLYSKLDLANFNLTKMPTLNGFWAQDGPAGKRIELKQENIDGVQYITCDLKKATIFPQKEGELVLDPLEAEATVRVRSRKKSRGNDPFEDFFNDPFFGGGFQDINQSLKSAPIKISVVGLPPNAPKSFMGAVGDFSMESYLDHTETQTNNPVTLTIKLSGTGNFKLLDPITLTLPPDLETYDPKIDNGNSSGSNTGQRKYEYLLIPRHSGPYNIKPIEFTYYSPAKEKYITLTSPNFTLNVLKGNESTESQISGQQKESVKRVGTDIRFIKTGNARFRPEKGFLFGSRTYFSILAAPIVFIGLFLFYFNHQKKINRNPENSKSKKAQIIAKKRLKEAKRFMENNQHEKVHEEISKSLYGYIIDKYRIPAREISRNQIEQVLLSDNKQQEDIKSFNEVIDACEFARFAPSQAIPSQDLYIKSLAVITNLETNKVQQAVL